jgi:hypothetical protein
MTIKQETDFLRRTKNYIIEINDKEIEVIKKWYIDDIANEYDVDYEIIDEEKLTDDEVDELCDFINKLN